MPSIANVKALGLSFTTQAIDQLPKLLLASLFLLPSTWPPN